MPSTMLHPKFKQNHIIKHLLFLIFPVQNQEWTQWTVALR